MPIRTQRPIPAPDARHKAAVQELLRHYPGGLSTAVVANLTGIGREQARAALRATATYHRTKRWTAKEQSNDSTH